MKKILSLILLAFTLLYSCKTDVDINADPKETMVIYGLLDQTEDIQYVKINKTFLGDKDHSAFDLALDPSKSNYDPSEIEAKVERWLNGVLQETYILRDTFLPKQTGVFYSDPDNSKKSNLIYYFKPSAKLNKSVEHRNSEYKLLVKNRKTGVIASSATELIRSFSKSNTDTNAFNLSVDVNGKVQFVNKTSGEMFPNVAFSWNVANHGRLYQLNVRFYYTEVNKLNTSDSVVKYVDWKFPEVIYGGEEYLSNATLKVTTSGRSFYQFVKASISPNESVWRRFKYLEFTVSAAEDNFVTYMDVNKPNSGFNIDKPNFTNITNITAEGKSEDGIGIYSSRTRVVKLRGLETRSLDTLKFGYMTRALEFRQ